MSLSRFYKKNQDFQAENLLPPGASHDNTPVWGESIVKEEVAKIEESVIAKTEKPIIEIIPEEPIEPLPDPTPPQPEIDLEAIKNEAFASGVDIGRKEAEEDFENSAKTFLNICNELDRLRETILKNSIPEMKELVMNISEKIIRQSITEQDKTIIAILKDAIQLAVKSDEIQIQINPDDLKCIEDKKQEIIDSMSGLENIILQPDATIERGGCKLESTCCTVDATLTSQIKVIRDNVMSADLIHEPKIEE